MATCYAELIARTQQIQQEEFNKHMNVFTFAKQIEYRVIIKGDSDTARAATGKYTNRPLSQTSQNGYGNTHATLVSDEETLARWFAETHNRAPGSLLFFYQKYEDND